jgi:anaphase-promoting complex subunit 4
MVITFFPSYLVVAGSACIAMINYVDVGYQELELAKYVKSFREDLMNTAMNLWGKGEVRRFSLSGGY